MDKLVASAQEAVADVPDGAVLAVGGFGLCGVPIADRRPARAGRGPADHDQQQLRRRRRRTRGAALRRPDHPHHLLLGMLIEALMDLRASLTRDIAASQRALAGSTPDLLHD